MANIDQLELPNGTTYDIRDNSLAVQSVNNLPQDIASFDGAAALPLSSLKIAINPIQAGEGDPSPENVRSISGWTEANIVRCGINLFDKTRTISGYINDNTGDVGLNPSYTSTDYISVKSGTQIYIHTDQTEAAWGAWYDKDKNYISGCVGYYKDRQNVKDVPSNACYVRLTVVTPNSGNINTLSVNYPATDTDYHAYTGETYNISFGAAGTVYGGTLNVTSGELRVTHGYSIFDGSADGGWTVGINNTHYRGYTYALSDIKSHSLNTQPTSAICDKIKTGIWENVFNGAFVLGQTGKAIGFGLDSLGITNDTDLNAWLSNNPITIVYELETPQTYQLTPAQVKSLLGSNNIWADTGEILEAKYVVSKYDGITAKTSEYANESNIAKTSEYAEYANESNTAINSQTVNNHTVGMDIPTPTSGDETKYLGGDGTFQEVSPKRKASGSVVSFTDGSTYPLSKCVISIEPVQAGSGEPSPSNVRPISGWDEANVTRYGKNLWGGEKLADDIVAKVPQATKDTTNKTVTYSAAYVTGKVLFDNFKPNTRYTIFMMTSSAANNITIKYTDDTNEYISKDTITVTKANKSIKYIAGVWSTGTTVLKYEECGIFEGVLTVEDFVPYNGSTISIPFHDDSDNPITVYGGTLNVTSGELRVTHANIASYNGETINEPWISSMDVYSAGATPTTGAQVVYPLATPQTYQLTPTQVTTLLGNNTIYADTGDISVEYVKEPFEDFATKDYVDAGLSTKQDTLTAGTNITITNNTISASDTNTTYTIGVSGNNITLTPSSGSAQSVTAPYATNAGKVNNHTVAKDVPSDAVFTDNNTTYTFAEGSTDGAFKVTPSEGSAQSVPVHGFQITELVDGTTTKTQQQTVGKTKKFIVEVDIDGGTNKNRALIINSSGKIAVSDVTSTELGYLDGVTSKIQTQLDAKQASITGGASSITSNNLTASRALVSNSSGKVASSSVTSTELGYLDGVTSNVQTQLGNKLSTSGGTVTGDIFRKTTNVMIGTTSNNGVTTDVSPGFAVRDSNDYTYARADGLAQTTGFVASRLMAKNKTTSGTEITNSLYAGVKKDGTRVVKLGDGDCTFIFGTNGAANLRSAINAQAVLSTNVTTTGTDGFYVRKYGNVIQIEGKEVAANKIGTVPSGYRPGTTVYVPCVIQGESNKWYFGFLGITTAGVITVHYLNGTTNSTTTSSSYHVWVSGSYIV